MKQLIYLVCFLIVGSACKEVFEEPPQALLQASILNSSTKKSISSVVTVKGIGIDSLWENQTSLSKILLPLSSENTTKFQLSFDSKVDTVSFTHEKTEKYDSMDSGFYYEFKLKSVECTHNRIDSILISDSLVTKTWHENIKIYLHPLSAGSN